jgi:hypothetical protein
MIGLMATLIGLMVEVMDVERGPTIGLLEIGLLEEAILDKVQVKIGQLMIKFWILMQVV